MKKPLKNLKWVEYQKMLIPNIAIDREITIDKLEALGLLKNSKALLMRWTTDFDKNKDQNFWYVICDHYDGFNGLKKGSRSEVKRGIKDTVVKIEKKDWILLNGFELYDRANKKYGATANIMKSKDYVTNIKNSFLNNNIDIWSIYLKKNKTLIGYAMIKIFKESVELSSLKIDPNYLKFRPSYNLVYNLLEHYLISMNYHFINSGARSLYHETMFQNFLISKFGFRKAYCSLNIFYKKRSQILIYLLKVLSKISQNKILDINPKINAILLQDSLVNEKNFNKKK